MLVGAFPPSNSKIVGGIVTSCKYLIDSKLSQDLNLILIDSTQISNPPPPFYIRLILALKRLFVFSLKIFFKKPDAVLVFCSCGASLIEKGFMLRTASIFKIPTLVFLRSGYIIENFYASEVFKRITMWAIGNSSSFLCQGKAWQNFAINELNYKKENTSIIYNWTASKDLLDVGKNKNNNSLKETTKILFLGWLDEEKGIFELLDVLKKISKDFCVELFVAGRGNSERKIRSLVKGNHLEESVHLLGWVNESRKISLLKQADIFILPSWAEGFPNALIEAMSAKVAVIASNVGNIPDVLTDRQEILLVPPKNNQMLEEAVKFLITNIEFRTSLAEQGYKFARENFSVDVGITKLRENIIDTIQINSMQCVE